ncbi:DUF1016 family protein [Dorea formicigenerans]|uniref:DUF1016 family protein n=1 Tax=Dorea formicigenerans TaxID=39486 RepID=A0A414Q507_9FIRM|nr:DUF1016 family protein [Dorea formicigenerans]
MDNFVKTDDILKDMCGIIESSQKAAYQAVNTLLVQRNWLIGYRIAEEELGGDERSEYGLEVIKKISKELTQRYGKGYDRSNLYHCLKFYKTFPEIVDTACRQSGVLLSWSHYRTLLQVKDPEARDWYEKEAAEQTWSVRTLQRNISSQYYYRMLKTQKKELVESEMKELTAPYQNDKLEFIKNPVVAEFLGFSQNTDFTESDLEKSILSNLQKFLMELGKGYAFVARQQHIHTEKQDYYIDLVFYNYILKCFVLIDLKTEKISFKYENESYHIEIDDVAVFPQCYAAVVDKIPAMAKKTLIVDIGSWTIDIMPVINKSPDESKCVTIPKGLITCMRSINEQCVRQLNGEVDESEIQNIMRYGRSDIDDEYFAIIKAEIEDFVDKVYNSIREFGYNLKTTPIVFVGGGAVVMKNFGSHDAKNISYNLDCIVFGTFCKWFA